MLCHGAADPQDKDSRGTSVLQRWSPLIHVRPCPHITDKVTCTSTEACDESVQVIVIIFASASLDTVVTFPQQEIIQIVGVGGKTASSVVKKTRHLVVF